MYCQRGLAVTTNRVTQLQLIVLEASSSYRRHSVVSVDLNEVTMECVNNTAIWVELRINYD